MANTFHIPVKLLVNLTSHVNLSNSYKPAMTRMLKPWSAGSNEKNEDNDIIKTVPLYFPLEVMLSYKNKLFSDVRTIILKFSLYFFPSCNNQFRICRIGQCFR